MMTMEFERIPERVYIISAIYRPKDGEPYQSFMFSALRRDDELWMHIEYSADAAQRTLALLQDSMRRKEEWWQWPDQAVEIDASQLVDMAREAPTQLPDVSGYVHDMLEVQWPKGRGNFVYWENVFDRQQPMFG